MTKSENKEKDARAKEAGSRRKKTENIQEARTPQHERRLSARRRKCSSAEPTSAGGLIKVSK